MSNVVQLENSDLPRIRHWVLVSLDKSRHGALDDKVLHGAGATFYVRRPYGHVEKAYALGRAIEWADSNSFPTVYVESESRE
jgi:hypothetical protein